MIYLLIGRKKFNITFVDFIFIVWDKAIVVVIVFLWISFTFKNTFPVSSNYYATYYTVSEMNQQITILDFK